MKCDICNLEFENKSSLANHVRWNHKSDGDVVNCKFCNNKFHNFSIEKHENACFYNPKNDNFCLYCGNKIKKHKKFCNASHSAKYNNDNGITGYKRIILDSGKHPNIKGENRKKYRTTCFEYWEKKCCICDWDLCLEVHHIDRNRNNNEPSNLVPLCPNHHALTKLKKYKKEIDEKILKIVKTK